MVSRRRAASSSPLSRTSATFSSSTTGDPRLCRGGSKSLTAPAVCFSIQVPRPLALRLGACDFDFGSRQGPFEGPATRKASGSAGGYLLDDEKQYAFEGRRSSWCEDDLPPHSHRRASSAHCGMQSSLRPARGRLEELYRATRSRRALRADHDR